MASVYRWGGYRGAVPAQIAGERLTQIAAENNDRLTPRAVVDDARPIDAALHKCFEWDDVRAAELHREQEARALIRGVRVVTQVQTETQPEDAQRVFVNIVEQAGDEIEHSYMPIAVVRQSPDLQRQVLAAARRDFMSWRSRYLDIARVVGADQVEERLSALTDVSSDHESQSANA
jgi:hypothetical protein